MNGGFFDDTYDRIIAFQSSTADYSSNSSILKPSSSGKRNIELLSNDEEDNLVDNDTVTTTQRAEDLLNIINKSAFESKEDYDGRIEVMINNAEHSTRELFHCGFDVQMQVGTHILVRIKPVNDKPSAKSSSPTPKVIIDLCSSDGGDDDDSSNANDQCSISSSSSSDGDVDYDDEYYNKDEEEYDNNDGGDKVH